MNYDVIRIRNISGGDYDYDVEGKTDVNPDQTAEGYWEGDEVYVNGATVSTGTQVTLTGGNISVEEKEVENSERVEQVVQVEL